MSDALIEVDGLRVEFPTQRESLLHPGRPIRAVDGIDLHIRRGETLGLVGESGCGKSTLGRTVLGFVRPASGKVRFDGTDLTRLGRRERRRRRREMQMIFQDPVGSLNPRMRVGSILTEGLVSNGTGTRASRREEAREALVSVGLPPDAMTRYPHEFSGGQRQRIVIARALMVKPRFVFADEPVAALDASIQSQILNLLVQLRDTFDLTYLVVAHDLAVVAYVSDRIAVMHLGKIVELAPTRVLLQQAWHPYTQALLSAVPSPQAAPRRERIVLRGEIPNPADPPSGCSFRTRCPLAQEICAKVEPPLAERADGRLVACHFAPDATADRAQLARGHS